MSESTLYTFRIEVYTSGLLISGSYDLPLYRRVSDALNSGMHRYITLRDATLASQSHPQQVQRIPQLLVDWGNALLVATLEEPSPPPDYEPTTPVSRDIQQMMFFTSHFALRAYFHKRPNLDLAATLEELTDDFIPLSDVQVFSLSGGLSVTRQFACLNREHIQAMYALGAAATPSLVPAAQAPNPVRDDAPGSEELPASSEPSVPAEETDDTESE
ncbi:MAG: hypothetical protein MI924_07395 [Chloroflexales bacterium]|nr:hypothetical protein [Chloroflexales bacterium]